jgi:hypothetical protein
MRIGARLAMIFLILVAALHLLRLAFGVEVLVGGVRIPPWASVLAVIGPGTLAGLLWRERGGGRRG